MNDRQRKALALLHSERREVRPLLSQALDTALVRVPAAGDVLKELTDIRDMGEKTAAELLFKLWLFLEMEHPGAWDQLVDNGSTLDDQDGRVAFGRKRLASQRR